jgi:GNAT superfamily N-acetyltransferase
LSLDDHLRAWLGAWPPPVVGALSVVAAPVRTKPGWDGRVRDVLGVGAPALGGVLSVAPGMAEGVVHDLGEASEVVGKPVWDACFRWCSAPAPFPDTGVWLPPGDERVPEWLKPFNGDVLVVLDGNAYVAGVGIKKHDQWGHELSVGTEPAAQGRGLARALVATAARRVIADGAVPTYLHDFRNAASAKVAEAAGFPDQGWKVFGTTAG